MALKLPALSALCHCKSLAVPSYGAMALKRRCDAASQAAASLAVPSYGAMALKPSMMRKRTASKFTCSPLLRGDGPETSVC